MKFVPLTGLQSIPRAAVLLGALAIAAVACAERPNTIPSPTGTAIPTAITAQPRPGDINTQVSSDRNVPEGWRRVQVREGYVSREFENPLVGFTIDLPPGWMAGESWPGGEGPAGWISGVAPSDSENVPVLAFNIGRGMVHSVASLEEDARRVVTRPVVDGEEAILYLARPHAINEGPQIGIYYEHIPDGPERVQTPSLIVDGDSRGFNDPELLSQVLQSIRYAEIDALPDLPTIELKPGPDWVRVPARLDFNAFSIMLPPEWEIEQLQGIDSMVGTISGDGIELFYDFGGYAGIPYDQSGRIRDGRDAPHLIWEESDRDSVFFIVRPDSSEPNNDNVTGVYVSQVVQPGQPWATMSISAARLDEEQQEVALAIMRSVEFESNPGTRK